MTKRLGRPLEDITLPLNWLPPNDYPQRSKLPWDYSCNGPRVGWNGCTRRGRNDLIALNGEKQLMFREVRLPRLLA
jgi:hypothetical protein